MNSMKQRKGTRPPSRPKGSRHIHSSFNYPSNALKDGKGSDYLNHESSNEHLIASFLVLVGCPVQVQTVQGVVYEGILDTISPKLDVTVKSVHLRSEKKQKKQEACNLPNKENVVDTRIFHFGDIVCMNCSNVDIDYARKDGILTDSTISGNGIIKHRELKKWEGSSEDTHSIATMGLDESGEMRNGWDWDDMVRVNKEKYGVKSSFDSSMSTYMSEIEYKDNEDFREKELKAQRLVNEMENEINFMEHDAIDSGATEEDMFSAVIKQDSQNSYYRNAPMRNRKGAVTRAHANSDHGGKPVSNSHLKKHDSDKPLYSQLVKKSIPQSKGQELMPRSSSASSPRTSSPTSQPLSQPLSQPTDEPKVKMLSPQPPQQGPSKKASATTSSGQQSSQVAKESGSSLQGTTEPLPTNGHDKPFEISRFIGLGATDVNGKISDSKKREIKDKVKYGKITPPQEAEERVSLESLRNFHASFKLRENVSKKKERSRQGDATNNSKPPEIHNKNDTKHIDDTVGATSQLRIIEVPDKENSKDVENAQPYNSPVEESSMARPTEVKEQLIEPAAIVAAEIPPQSVSEVTSSNNKDVPVVETQNQETPHHPQKEVEEDKVDISKSTLNPFAKEFDPRKRFIVPVQVQHPVSSAVQHQVYSSSPNTIQHQIQGGIIHANQPATIVAPRHTGVPNSKRSTGRMVVGPVQEPAGAVVTGNHVPAYIQNGQPMVFVPPQGHYPQGQVIPLPVQQPHQAFRYVVNAPVNQPTGVHQGIGVGASGYQDGSQAVFMGSQSSQVMPSSVMTPAQPGYAQIPANQPGVQRYVLPVSGHYTQITNTIPPSQQGGTPGPQMHPHATIHPSPQQQRPLVFFPHPAPMGMPASQIVTGQPHPAAMQSFQHTS